MARRSLWIPPLRIPAHGFIERCCRKFFRKFAARAFTDKNSTVANSTGLAGRRGLAIVICGSQVSFKFSGWPSDEHLMHFPGKHGKILTESDAYTNLWTKDIHSPHFTLQAVLKEICL
jgi:hypothetical protein